MSESQLPREIRAALGLLEEAEREAVAAIEAAPNSQQALERAAAFFRAVHALRGRMAQRRNQLGRQIWSEEELALAHLADLMGVTKGRASQLFSGARAAKTGTGETA